MAFPAKFPSRCAGCGRAIDEGDMIDFDRESRKAWHEDCTPADKKWKPPARSGFRSTPRHDDDEKPAYRKSGGGSPFANMPIGGNGPRIGIVAFNKHIAVEMQQKLMAGKDLFTGSPEQDDIWKEFLNGSTHMITKAAAGTGKSTTAQQGVLRMIREQDASAKAMTYHSLGLSILRKHYGKVDVSEHKLEGIVDTLTQETEWRGETTDDDWYGVIRLATQLVRLCKNYMEPGTDADRLVELADYHNIDYDERLQDEAFKLVPEIIRRDIANPTSVDYDDMPWLPVVLNLQANLFDILIIDEAQDTNRAQQALVKLACPKGRVVVIGDRWQAIYGFRGADTEAMDRLEQMLASDACGVKTFPLTVTRRCPTSHVEMAQAIVGSDVIRPMDDAIRGRILQVTEEQALSTMSPGDLVICRVNRPLVPICYELIQRGVKAIVRGRDIGAGLEALIKKVGAPETVAELTNNLDRYYTKELARLSNKKHAENRIEALRDRCGTLHELMSGCEYTSEVITKIQKIFADFEDNGAPKQAVILGTVHRTKGLEADRVFVLAPELIPHPMATKAWEVDQEHNLAYVAATRSKRDLIFVGGIPEIYGMGDAVTAGSFAVPQSEEDFHEGTY